MIQIQNQEQMQDFMNKYNGHYYWIFKHSATCPISRRAFRELEDFLETPQGSLLPVAMIVVQQARDVSNEIAEKYGVQHQSPQIFLVKQNEVVWHASHGQITAQQLLKVTTEQLGRGE